MLINGHLQWPTLSSATYSDQLRCGINLEVKKIILLIDDERFQMKPTLINEQDKRLSLVKGQTLKKKRHKVHYGET